MITTIFKLLATTISIYTMLCFIRIMLTWIPGASYSSFGRFLSGICDPYLNLFRGIRWLRFSNFDFTPAIALCILIALSTVFGNFALTRTISLGSILAILVRLSWSIFSSFIGFIAIVLAVRLVIMFLHKDSGYYGSIWEQVDHALSPFVFRITNVFSGGRPVPYKNALITGLIILILMQIGGSIIINTIAALLLQLPL
jgi:YggT family protein